MESEEQAVEDRTASVIAVELPGGVARLKEAPDVSGRGRAEGRPYRSH